ncbi:M20/M25/M40 family metallo-hydrolase [Acetobacter senegalensis]|uniref:M20/M25/M40 family metallo-hydrolase n=1 Tax=Acetobacter senegalensis TaxID=446692 RepID=UPI001EDB324F|nr:M20/M25/M40 family metallo-hydrolase [Acetobacter senegalensis]MCG4262339.1 M20/M25/M40 family metallo-hydrolase [Acetobacter senegalensis]
MTVQAALTQADTGLDASLSRLFDLLRIPSISTQPEHAPDCRKAAEWLVDTLKEIGFEASVRETPGHPMVVGHAKGPEGAPHVLFYGHYDVQPVDPLDLWHSAPFEPVMVKGPTGDMEITARGAADDKGQVMTFLEACRALKAADGTLPLSVTVLIEGEEESGGVNLLPFLEANRDELKADVALICDTGMLARGMPAITTMLRGMVGEEVTITCANRDLHSGMYGNAARNPIQLLCDILSDLRDGATGRVTLPGFYEGVPVIPEETRALWRKIGPTDQEGLAPVGLSLPAGEIGYTALEQTWCRPSCEINGISGGYEEKGFKTVLPSKAMAKVSFRLVGDQDPEKIRAAFRAHVQTRLPADCSAEFVPHGGSRASIVSANMPFLPPALTALEAEWQHPAAVIGCGGSIPVVTEVQQALGMDSLLIGFGLEDDRVHSPNEKYDLTCFHKGIRSWIRVLCALTGNAPQ